MVQVKEKRRIGNVSALNDSHARRVSIQHLARALGVTVVQLHHYALHVFETLKLELTFIDPGDRYQTSVVDYSIDDNSSFDELLHTIEKDIIKIVQTLPDISNVKVDVNWLAEGSERRKLLGYQLNPMRNYDFNDVHFSIEEGSLFQTVSRNAQSHFNAISSSVRHHPEQSIRKIKWFTERELNEIQNFSYGPLEEGTTGHLLHSLFEQIAEQYPDQAAVQVRNKMLTYGDLNSKANQLAITLIQSGVKPGDFIGVLLDRSTEAYIAIIGILKAGAAYVPIDPDFPTDRVQFILDDASVRIVITSENHFDKVTSFKWKIICLSGGLNNYLNRFGIRHRLIHNPNVKLDSSSPAYVIYTSGSTGKPKGVIIPHAAVTNLVISEREIFNVRSGDKVLQGFSLAFDASIEEIWLAFMRGATLVPAAKEIMCSGEAVCDFIDHNKITVLSTVPTLLSNMRPDLPSLRLLILGGEAVSHSILDQWYRDSLRIVNTYGPTESTVIATYSELKSNEKITIGRPIQNYAAFITDKYQRRVPKGVPGELCLAGQGLALGYINQQELTARKFIEPSFPLSKSFKNRIYRTGDLAMFNSEGQIEFLGRIDSQVKVRGYRIELAEIESQLLQYENIQNAVVAVKPDEHKVDRLVGYVVLKDTSLPFDEVRCKKFLGLSLSAYMIPSLFTEIQNIPTLPSGKVDRQKLPEPINNFKSTRIMIPPRTEWEKQIYPVWKKLFDPHEVSIHDNFFLDLGGHSLLAARMISELRQMPSFNKISVLDVYKHPTIERLASFLSSQKTINEISKPLENPTRYIPSRIKHFWCGLLQFLSLYFVFGINSVMGATGYLIYFYFRLNEHTWMESAAWALLSTIVVYPTVIFLAIALKWVLLGRIKPGRYKLWGWFYFRWWLVQNVVQVIGFDHFSGTPILPFLYRLLGVKIGRDVHLSTEHLGAYDLITIGEGSSIDKDSKLTGFSVKDGYLNVGNIQIGDRCFIGERSVLSENSRIENDARLEDLSLLSEGACIPAGETWSGSPAQFKHAFTTLDQPIPVSPGKRVSITLLYIGLIFIIPILSFISFIPGIAILYNFNIFETPLLFLAMIPIVGAIFILVLTLESVVLKWLLVGKVNPGKYPVHGSFYIRNWIVEHLLKLSLDYAGQLHATLHVAHWYRALGMKIGKFVELSTAITATPDLVNLSDESTIADEVSLGTPHVERGWMTLAKVKLGRRAFVGNSGVVPSGREMGDGSLVGVLSIAPNAQESRQFNATWFGSPSILFPKRETNKSFSDEKTYRPSRWMRVKRGTFELLRITLPPTGFILVTVTMIHFGLLTWESIGLGTMLMMLPIIYALASIGVVLITALIKWVVVGKYKPFVKPLWSNFVWRLEFVNALYEFLSAPLLLQTIQGTPLLPWYLRFMGAKIGSMCYLDTTGFLEWDLVNIGDRVAIGEDAIMQTHLFEDRILKASEFQIGDDCYVGAASVVLYNTMMHSRAKLDNLSLLMKGESLPADTEWRGIPALSKNISEQSTLKKENPEHKMSA